VSACFITTAVCESLGLPDDCEPLQLLRAFRDSYMMATPDGRGDVQHYYSIAPEIVARIDALPDRNKRYQTIYTTYLRDTLQSVRAFRHEEARRLYRQMVADLEGELLGSSSTKSR
jgi:hypothetical protein